MSKFLYVCGNGDYSALEMEESGELEHIKSIMEKKDLKEYISEDGSSCTIHEFGEVDEQFFNFMKNTIGDYDLQKQSNVYRIK